MGTFVGTISQRDSLANTPARMVEFANRITEAMLGCGMLKVSDAEFAGQAGTFTTDAPTAGQTQLTALGTTTGADVIGYNLFKHPTLNLYVQVHYLDVGFATTSSRAGYVRFTVATGLAAGALDNAVTVTPWSGFNTSSVNITLLPTTYTQFFASCGSDHFWIGGKPIHVFGTSSSYSTYPSSASPLCLGVFCSDLSPSNLAIVATAPVSVSGSNTYGLNFGAGATPAACRYWVTNGAAWTQAQNGALGYVLDPSVPTSSEGVRIARASKIIDGQRHRFNLGYINSASVVDAALIDVDLIGETQTYRAVFGFGPASPSFYNAVASDLSGTILPWAA